MSSPHESHTGEFAGAAPEAVLATEHSPMLGADSVASSLDLVRGIVDPSTASPTDLLAAGIVIAPHLLSEGRKQVHTHLIKGENEAIRTIFGTLIDPVNGNVMLDSPFGAGKSTTLEGIFRVIEGLNRIAYVPGRIDLTPEELVGKTKQMVTTRMIDGESYDEHVTGHVYPMVDAETQALILDEVPHTSPRTQSVFNSILARRVLENTRGGHEAMDDLEIAVTAKNPQAGDPSVPRLRRSFVDRFGRGVIMGAESEWRATLQAMGADFEPTPEAIQPVITLPMLHVAQAAVRYVSLDPREAIYAQEAAIAVAEELRADHWHIPILTTPYRTYSQLQSVARTEALLDGERTVSVEHIGRALRTKLIASLTGNDMAEDYQEVYEAADRVARSVGRH